MKLADLFADVVAQLPEERRKVMEGLVTEFGVGDNCRFMLALVAGATKSQRQIVRLLLNDLERLEIEGTKQ